MWIAVATVLWTRPVLAQATTDAENPDLARAVELYKNGERLYQEGEYEAAIVAFQAAMEASGRAELNFNLANCHERLNQLAEARRALVMYRAVAPAAEQETLDRRISALDRRIAESTAPALPVPGPAPVPVYRSIRVPWVVSGIAATTLGLGAAALTYSESRRLRATGNEEAYKQARAWNGVSWGGATIGAGLVVTGLSWKKPEE